MSQRTVRSTSLDDGSVLLLAPAVGEVRELSAVGDVVVPGRPIGVLEALGRREVLLAPLGVGGRVVERRVSGKASAPVGFGDELLRLDPRAAGGADAGPGESTASRTASLVFRSPMSGRFYARSAPSKPPLVSVGEVIELGHGVCLLEVMKTFNRVSYGGEGLPPRVRIVRVVPTDGEDVARGSILLELEPV